MNNSANNLLNTLLQKQKRYQFLSMILIVLGLLCWLFWPLVLAFEINVSKLIFCASSLFIFIVICYYLLNKNQSNKTELVKHLNQTYPSLEYSAQLIDSNVKHENILIKVQQSKIKEQFNSLYPSIKTKHHLKSAFLFLCINVFAVLLSSFIITDTAIENQPKEEYSKQIEQNETIETIKTIPKLLKSSIKITPMLYTNLKPIYSDKFSLEIQEGSQVKWDIIFDSPIKNVQNIINNNTKNFTSTNNTNWKTSYKANNNFAYQTIATSDDNLELLNQWNDVKVLRDNKPIANLKNLEVYTELNYYDVFPTEVQVVIQDDYGVEAAAVNLLKSSGEGESVQFKKVSYPINQKGKNIEQTVSINLKELKPEPGDEIFIRLSAKDNCPFRVQQSFSNTHIISIKDTVTISDEFGDGLGMDIQPEYFRSQRQIIIDTEQLLSESKNLNQQEFKNRSNNIAIDQKLLRLRYGKFLGEEFEGEIGEDHSHHDHEHHDHDDTHDDHKHHNHDDEHDEHEHHYEGDGHDHSDDDLEMEAPDPHAGHDHGGEENPDPEAEQTVEDLISPYVHAHDNADVNTYFESETKTKLKAALAQMWESELHLRTAEPNKALPFENKALKLIKEVQQANRIYVERVGLEVRDIPIDKKRLTGDINEVFSKDASVSLDNSYNNQTFIDGIEFVNSLTTQIGKTLNEIHNNGFNDLIKAIYEIDQFNTPAHLKVIGLIRQQKNEYEIKEEIITQISIALQSIQKQRKIKTGTTDKNSTELKQIYLDKLNN